MSIVLPLVAVVELAVFAIAAALLASVAATRPDRAAVLVVLAGGSAAVVVVGLGLLVVGIAGMESAAEMTAVRRGGTVDVHPVRALVGLTTAVVLLGGAAWLARTTDWSRADLGDEGEEVGA